MSLDSLTFPFLKFLIGPFLQSWFIPLVQLSPAPLPVSYAAQAGARLEQTHTKRTPATTHTEDIFT